MATSSQEKQIWFTNYWTLLWTHKIKSKRRSPWILNLAIRVMKKWSKKWILMNWEAVGSSVIFLKLPSILPIWAILQPFVLCLICQSQATVLKVSCFGWRKFANLPFKVWRNCKRQSHRNLLLFRGKLISIGIQCPLSKTEMKLNRHSFQSQ